MEVCPPADRKHRLPFEILAAEDTAITIAKDTTAGLQSPGSGDIALDACALAAYADETVAFNFPNTSVVQSPPLHFPASDITVATATPPKRRRGKCMSRRRGQNGQIVISGNWYRVRFWIDVPGQERRLHRSERICPVCGTGLLSKSQRERRAREIIAASGADTAEYFNKVVKQKAAVTFREQSEWWLKHVQTRKRNPVASSTIETWRSCLAKWLNPNIGELPLSDVNNAALKTIIATMSDSGLAPKSINNYAQVVKMVVASSVNEQGEQIHLRKWNHEFIDMPMVEKDKQNTPCFSSEVMTGLASWGKKRERMLFILCGAAGLRIGEVLGIEIDRHISQDFLTISIVQKVRRGKVEHRLKTRGQRQVDLHPLIGALLKEFVGNRTSGFLFCTRTGRPLSQSNIISRHLHKALKELGYVNPYTGTHKAGNHAFRRFRITYLRNRTNCAEGVRKFWLGHAGRDMGDLYDKIKEDVAFRKEVAERCGFGFNLLLIVPNVPNSAREVEVEGTTQVV
jgi:integrase